MFKYTMIDEKGQFMFEPVEIDGAIELYNGDNFIIKIGNPYRKEDTDTYACYDSKMNLIGKLNITESGSSVYASQIYDGVIIMEKKLNYMEDEYMFYKTDFTPLFDIEQTPEQ